MAKQDLSRAIREVSAKLQPAEEFYFLYARAVLAYHQGDIEELRNLELTLRRFSDLDPEWQAIKDCFYLRLWSREKTLNQERVGQLEKKCYHDFPYWQGEIQILVGNAYAGLSMPAQAILSYAKAANNFRNANDFSRSIFAEFSELAMQTHLDQQKNRIPHFHALARRALRGDEKNICVAGLCYLNMAREYQLIGAHHAALNFSNRSVRHLESEYGSRNHLFAVAQRADVWLVLKRNFEAQTDIEICASSVFSDVKEAAEILREKLNKNLRSEAPKIAPPLSETGALPPAWQDRNNELSRKTLTSQEEALVRFVAAKMRTREELLEHMFDGRLDYESRIARLHNLLARVRKKFPELLCHDRQGYFIADAFAPLFLNSKGGT